MTICPTEDIRASGNKALQTNQGPDSGAGDSTDVFTQMLVPGSPVFQPDNY